MFHSIKYRFTREQLLTNIIPNSTFSTSTYQAQQFQSRLQPLVTPLNTTGLQETDESSRQPILNLSNGISSRTSLHY